MKTTTFTLGRYRTCSLILAFSAAAAFMPNTSLAQQSAGVDSAPSAISPAKDLSYPKNNPVEVGMVKWGRDLDAALARSNESGKPVLLLFQEVPG